MKSRTGENRGDFPRAWHTSVWRVADLTRGNHLQGSLCLGCDWMMSLKGNTVEQDIRVEI